MGATVHPLGSQSTRNNLQAVLEHIGLTDNHQGKESNNGNLDGESLEDRLAVTGPSRSVKCLPSIRDAQLASAAQNGRHHLSAERPVERHDGLVLLGQHGRSHADEDRPSRDRCNQSAQPRDGERSSHLAGSREVEVGGIDGSPLKREPRAHHQRQEERTSNDSLLKGIHRGNVHPALVTRNPLVEALGRGLGDDNVDPGELQVGEDDANNHVDDELAKEVVQGHREHGGQESLGVEHDDEHGETTEPRPEAGAGAKVLDGRPQLTGDGTGGSHDELGVCVGRVDGLGRVLVGIDAHEDVGVGVLDGRQGGDQHSVGVFDLHY